MSKQNTAIRAIEKMLIVILEKWLENKRKVATKRFTSVFMLSRTFWLSGFFFNSFRVTKPSFSYDINSQNFQQEMKVQFLPIIPCGSSQNQNVLHPRPTRYYFVNHNLQT